MVHIDIRVAWHILLTSMVYLTYTKYYYKPEMIKSQKLRKILEIAL